ncbi:branched-chain amino acid transaminase [Streptomyces sp. NPDC050504]|uniref:branched-chain amino acid transaminase n=1 Tax=Streptomyces sp. NPDC050504 TaxID=3365618 RepID=UPI0037A39BAE
MNAITPSGHIWMDGLLVPWDEARVHVLTQSLHYGWAVYEGIRAHGTADGPAVFRLDDHLARLTRSARVYMMDIPYTEGELARAVCDLVAATGSASCYVRPLVYLGYGSMGVALDLTAVRVTVAAWPWEEGRPARNWRLMTSAWRRNHQDAIPPLAKATGAYLNSSLAKLGAVRSGCDDALMLTPTGHVAEASAANVFLVSGGVLRTPPVTEGILPGITRATVLELARAAGVPTEERPVAHAEAYTADELFLTGTAVGVVPVEAVDTRVVGRETPGPVTRLLRAAYEEAVRGKGTRSGEWLTGVRG